MPKQPMDQWQQQKSQHDLAYSAGSRAFVTNADPLVQYLVRWRLTVGLHRLMDAAGGRLTSSSRILVMCGGEGFEGSVLCDLGFMDVTVSDISDAGVAQAMTRDNRLKGLALNAERADLKDNSFDIVMVQDGLHHLRSPVQGFTEMLRIASVGTMFFEPHAGLAGDILGTKWEKIGDAVNYVFRWDKRMVQDIASSYLGKNAFQNLSFSFWHHNLALEKLGKLFGGGNSGVRAVKTARSILNLIAGGMGNQFCGLIVKNPPVRGA